MKFNLRSTHIRNIRLAPFGWHTRYLLRSYLSYIVIVVSALLLIALTIDLTPRWTKLLASRPEVDGVEAIALIAYYILLRSVDILARNLPLAIYFAVLWSEFAHTLSSERIVVNVSGRSPLQSLVPALMIGLIFGCIQLTLDLWLRPAAVMAHVTEHLGSYGERFDRRPTTGVRWVKVGDDLISARVTYGPPPALRDVTLYRLQTDGQPREVMIARDASPGRLPATWQFTDGFYWQWTEDRANTAGRQGNARPSAPVAFEQREISLDLDSRWLANLGIFGKYLPQSTLEALASSASPSVPKSDYQTWVQVRYARGLFVLGMVLLAASLGQIALYSMPPLYGVLGILLAGYIAHVAVKVFEVLGELGIVPPVVAGWLVPTLLVVGAVGIQLRTYRTIG